MQLDRTAEGSIEVRTSGCPDENDGTFRLVARSGDLILSDTAPTFSGGQLVWDYYASPYGRQHRVGAGPCVAQGTLETDQRQVQWLRKKTYGSKGIGILALTVGGLMSAGGVVGIERGLSNDVRPVTYIGVGAVALGVLVLTLGLYHLVRPTTTETLFGGLSAPTN